MSNEKGKTKKRVNYVNCSYAEYKSLGAFQTVIYNIVHFLVSIPIFLGKLLKNIGLGIKTGVIAIGKELRDVVLDFIHGSWRTKLSYVIMGFGNFAAGQPVRGALFLIFEAVFAWYTITIGAGWMSQLDNLGDVGPHEEYNAVLDTYITIAGDDSFKILLFGGLSLVFCLVFLVVWRMNIRQSRENDRLIAEGKKPAGFKKDMHDLVDAKFHKTLLTIPIIGISLFTVLPTVFMIAVAFTNYDGAHNGNNNLFTWVGWQNFVTLFTNSGSNSVGYAFSHILGWTMVWAFFATFSNYFLGMILALMINRKGIKLKKLWRGIFVMTIAIPQFISLLYMSKLFSANGLINGLLYTKLHWLSAPYDFWGHTLSMRIMVILINIWVGVPYLMLMATGI